MDHFRRDELQPGVIPGRAVQRAVGREGQARSEHMNVGFAHFSAEHGEMEPHCHGEEGMYVLDARDGWIEYGPAPDQLTSRCDLEAGTVLHAAEGEWHVFRHTPDGFVDIVFFFSPPIW